MGVISDHSKNAFQIKFLRIFLSTRNYDNTLDAFIDISRFVKESGFGKVKTSIDSNDFDFGFFEQPNFRLSLDNSKALFMKDFGFFDNKLIDRSVIKIEAGYRSLVDYAPDFETVFEGIIEADSIATSLKNETRSFTVLSKSSIIKKLKSRAGVVTNGMLFKDAFFNLFDTGDVTTYLNLDINDINPAVNLTIDDASKFNNKSLKASIDKLLLASNSVMVIENDDIIIKNRDEGALAYTYYGKGGSFPSNILDITSYHDGEKRVFTSLVFEGDLSTYESSSYVISLYGFKQKTIDIPFITDPAKNFIISQNILTEFQIPKREMIIKGPYIGNEIKILDTIKIDNPGYVFDVDAAKYDNNAFYDQNDQYVDIHGGIRIKENENFKVLSIEHDYQKYTTTLKVRAKGTTQADEFD